MDTNPWRRLVRREQPREDEVYDLLSSLPAWFGDEESNREYAQSVGTWHTWAARQPSGRLIGVIAASFDSSHAEIELLAVDAAQHRKGLGRTLLAAVEDEARRRGLSTVLVRTLADTDPSEAYAKTREFYRACGYVDAGVTCEWGEANPCLHMRHDLLGACDQQC